MGLHEDFDASAVPTRKPSTFDKFFNAIFFAIDGPVEWFRVQYDVIIDGVCRIEVISFKIIGQVPDQLSYILYMKYNPGEKVVEPNRKEYYWYHRKYRRVPTIDQCYTDDFVCIFEANQQFARDKRIENILLSILKKRVEDCMIYEEPMAKTKCAPLDKDYKDAAENWFTKYGDLGALGTAREALAKQKHRMLWERKYGAVGTGKIPLSERKEE